jgi:regulatory protein
MLVTKIERQKRDAHRANLFIDGEFAFGVQDEVLLRSGIRKGDQLTQEELEAIQASGEFALAKRQALRILARRLRSEAEIRTHLLEKEFHPGTVDRVLVHLRELRLVDDLRFARACVHDMRLRRALGRIALERQLRLRGIARSTIMEVLGEVGGREDDTAIAFRAVTRLLERFNKSRKKLLPEQQRARAIQFLARRGFDGETISAVITRATRENRGTHHF